MATKLWHVPVRLATGAVILDQGLQKLDADEDTAKWLHGRAVVAFPQLAEMEPKAFAQLLSTCEIALGVALLGIGFVPSGLAGLGLTAFGGSLTRLYLSAPGTRREGTIAPSMEGITLVKDSWMLAIGLALVVDTVFGSSRGRRKKKS
jgi:DoxX